MFTHARQLTGRLQGETLEDLPGLYGLLTPYQPSATYNLTKVRFDQAAGAYRKARYPEAAEGFMAAAALLRNTGMEEEATVQSNRQWTYKNAASAFMVAKAKKEGRAAFTAALRDDPACADVLREILRDLDEHGSP